MNASNVRLNLALQATIRKHIGPIVLAAEADVTKLENSGMLKNQLQNVLNVAEESHNVAVVTNFVRYQMGRSGVGGSWRHNGFGLQVVRQISHSSGKIAQQTTEILDTLPPYYSGPMTKSALETDVRYELTRAYLGYLIRAFVYADKTKSWDQLRKASQGG